jgi:hypothetical protein
MKMSIKCMGSMMIDEDFMTAFLGSPIIGCHSE